MRLSAIFLVALTALAATALAAEHTNPAAGFRLEYDDTAWEVVPAKPDPAIPQKTLVTLQKKQADERYHARFSVVEESAGKFKGTPAEQVLAYRKHALDFLKSQRFDILTTTDRALPGVKSPAFEITANQRDFGLTFRQVGFVREGKAYLLTAAARTARFAPLEKEMKPLFDTFRFTK